MNILRKIRSALDFLLHGQFVKFFNALMMFLRLHSVVSIGDTYLYTIEPFGSRPDTLPPSEEIIRCETDPAVIDKLLACMEGTSDYPWIKPEDRRKKFEDLFHRGSRVWTIESAEAEVIGFIWETRHAYSYSYGDRTLVFDDLPDDMAFQEFLFIGESWRRRRFHTKLLNGVHRASPNVQFSGAITEDNEPSILAHLKYGFRRNGRILHFRCFGLVFVSLRFGKMRRFLFRIKKGILHRLSLGIHEPQV